MICTPLYYDKNNYERKKKWSKWPLAEGRYPVMVAPSLPGSPYCITPWVSLPSCHFLSIPYPPCKQLLTAVGVRCWALTPPILIPPPLSVITHTHQPSSLWAVASSGGVWCHGCHHLPLIPIIVLPCVGGAGSGAGGIGGVVLDAHCRGGPLAPDPLSEQGLAVVGGGCWHSSRAAPIIHPTSDCS